MAPVVAPAQPNGLGVSNNIKRPIPLGPQTNGPNSIMPPSASPTTAFKKLGAANAKQQLSIVADHPISATSTVRPANRMPREGTLQAGTHLGNSAGLRVAPVSNGIRSARGATKPGAITAPYVLKKHAGRPPSLIVHLHPTHFRFDGQDGMFSYRSPMSMFIEHIKQRTIPHDILEYLIQADVPFYDGCLIVQIYDHKSIAQAKDAQRPAKSSPTGGSSINKYNPYLTPSPYAPFPKDEQGSAEEKLKSELEAVDAPQTEKEDVKQEEEGRPASASEGQKSKTPPKPKIFTVVLHPTPESLQRDLLIKATTPASQAGMATPGLPPPTPSSLVPQTPTAGSMPPPAKRVKREKMELEPGNIHAAEGQILLATAEPLILTAKAPSVEAQIALLEAMSNPQHSEPPPQPKTRKRTVAEMAADEAAAAEQERYLLFMDDRGGTNGSQSTSATDADGQTGASSFESRFERFKVMADIKREHAEKKEQKKEQERLKQQENDRRLQAQKQQALQEQQAQKQQQQNEEKARREATLRESQARQQTTSTMAASPPRPSSVVQNPAMSVPMAHNMSARGSQQSHPSGTPRMPHSTPQMAHGTPISRAQAMGATPRMGQASPPPNMMAQNSQMGQAQPMMMNGQNMPQNAQLMAQMAAHQRAQMMMQQQQQQQQQQQAQQHQQQHPQQQQQPQQPQQAGMLSQQQLAQQYAQSLQSMHGSQMRQMSPQMVQMQQQIARMQHMAGANNMQRQYKTQSFHKASQSMQQQIQRQRQQQMMVQQQHQLQQQQQAAAMQQGMNGGMMGGGAGGQPGGQL
ncbi:transcription factor SPT20 [Geosmithia morbida]|uniref:Transcription factor SPT20 n=1 Tax=Geosmithia morbida TaxID=1094350 RepID=A0A9P4YSF7_9HYPO|nr:transcription factor SPT20 [Geosmithia morbida]KAF4121677.1 transcription factor SPT20 [Geosmithia morbida]